MIFALLLAGQAPAAAAPKLPVPDAVFDCPAGDGLDAALCRALGASEAGQPAVAAAEFETAAKAAPPSDPRQVRLLAAAGNMWIAADQPGKAAIALDRALAGTGLQAEQRGEALLDRARAAEGVGDLKGARAKVTEALPSIGDDPFLWYFSAALAIRENDPAAAKISVGRALALAPNDPTILFEAGHVAQLSGDQAKARDYWTRALAADPVGKPGQLAKAALALLDAPAKVPAPVEKK